MQAMANAIRCGIERAGRTRTGIASLGRRGAKLLGVGIDLDRSDHPVAFVDLMQTGSIDGVGVDLADADTDDLFGILRCDLGVHLRILLAAVADEHKVPVGHALDHVIDHSEFAFASDDQPFFNQLIPESKPFQVHAANREFRGAEKLVERVVDLPWTAADVVEHRTPGGPFLVDLGHPVDGRKGFGESSPEHLSTAAHIGLFDRIIDVGDHAHTGIIGQKHLAADRSDAIVPLDRAFAMGIELASGQIESALKQTAGLGLSRQDVLLVGDRDSDPFADHGADEEPVDTILEQSALGRRLVELEGSDEGFEHKPFCERRDGV